MPPGTGCCGALRTHLSDAQGGLDDMRRNIDAWSAQLLIGGHRGDYFNRQRLHSGHQGVRARLGARCRLCRTGRARQRVGARLERAVAAARACSQGPGARLPPRGVPAFHAPCTLQHGQKLRGGVELHLRALGFDVSAAYEESHLCCGSAGTYSVLQPQLAQALRDRKLTNLAKLDAGMHLVRQCGLHSASAIRNNDAGDALD